MATHPAEANLSDLLNKPKATLARLAGSRRLLLHRRDAEDLVLTTADRAAADTALVRDTTRLFQEMVRQDPAVMNLAVQVLPSVFPWVRHLADDARQEFAAEWLDALSAAGDLGNGAAVEGDRGGLAIHGRDHLRSGAVRAGHARVRRRPRFRPGAPA